MSRVFALLLLCAVALAVDPHDFFPCSFQSTTLTHILSGGVEVATSEDALYHDHDNLWRWDSEFSGLPGLFEPHVWSIIWRPDNGASYHHLMLEGVCKKNNGGSKMYPYPYDWISSKTDGMTWTQEECVYNDETVWKFSGKGKSTQYKFTLESNLFMKKNGELVFSNGTVQSSMIDVEFKTDINQFISHARLQPKLFQTAPPCPAVTLPADPSREFVDVCYRSTTSSSSNAGFAVKPSILALVASILAALVICLAL